MEGQLYSDASGQIWIDKLSAGPPPPFVPTDKKEDPSPPPSRTVQLACDGFVAGAHSRRPVSSQLCGCWPSASDGRSAGSVRRLHLMDGRVRVVATCPLPRLLPMRAVLGFRSPRVVLLLMSLYSSEETPLSTPVTSSVLQHLDVQICRFVGPATPLPAGVWLPPLGRRSWDMEEKKAVVAAVVDGDWIVVGTDRGLHVLPMPPMPDESAPAPVLQQLRQRQSARGPMSIAIY
jgi:hypothetical protein